MQWGVSVDLCQLFLMHNQSICQSQYVSLPIQMLVSSPLVPKVLTCFYNLLILTNKSMWVAWALQAFRALNEEVGLGWIYAMTNHQPVSPIQEKKPAWCYLCLAFHFLHCVSATGRDGHHWSDSGLISFTWIYWHVFCGLVGWHYARTSKLNVTWHIHSRT